MQPLDKETILALTDMPELIQIVRDGRKARFEVDLTLNSDPRKVAAALGGNPSTGD